jgi:uncharacterized membrane protein
MHRVLLLAHLVAIAAYLGSSLFLALLIEVVGRDSSDAPARRGRWAELFAVYNPFSIAALGVIVITGAWALTPYKEALGAGYFEKVGQLLAGKLALAFAVVMSGTWVSFGICHRLVRAHQGKLPVTDRDLDRLRARLRVALWITCALTVLTVWVATGMNAPALPS